MRRTQRAFTVEVKNPRRNLRAPSERPPEYLDDIPDDVPARDIRADLNEQPAYESPAWAREQAEALFNRDRKPVETEPAEDDLPIHSLDIFPPLPKQPAPETVEAQPEPETPPQAEAAPVEERKPRILPNINTAPDPVQALLAEAAERRSRRGRRATPQAGEQAPVTSRKARAFDTVPVQPEIPAEPVTIASPVTAAPLTLPPLRLRPRHKTPRILYNAWNYKLFLREARHVEREVAQVILKPGKKWKRRLPVDMW